MAPRDGASVAMKENLATGLASAILSARKGVNYTEGQKFMCINQLPWRSAQSRAVPPTKLN